MKKTAIISQCEQYRYVLTRTWDEAKPNVVFVMLNPSTADADKDDNTIRRCVRFAKDWGFGSLTVVNLFALRATDPRKLWIASNPIGSQNMKHLTEAFGTGTVVCAWGNAVTVKKVLKQFPEYNPFKDVDKDFYYIDLAKDGTPRHPLYLRGDCEMRHLKHVPFM